MKASQTSNSDESPSQTKQAAVRRREGLEPHQKLLTPEEIADRLFIHRSTVRRMILDRQLPAICLISGRRKKVFRVREDALNRWVASREKAFSNMKGEENE